MHDSRAVIPLSLISAARVTSLYDVMDAAYCSNELHENCRSLGHVNRGRDTHYWAPPAQIRTCGIPAYGSYHGCLTAKRCSGHG